jgi:hypothetical protein
LTVASAQGYNSLTTMNKSAVTVLFSVGSLLIGCQTDRPTPQAHIQQLGAGQCIFYIPYRRSDMGADVKGTVSVTEVPGASLTAGAHSQFGYVAYIGKCIDPMNAKLVQTPELSPKKDTSVESVPAAKVKSSEATPAPSDGATKPKVDKKIAEISVKIVEKSNYFGAFSFIYDSVGVYEAVNRYAKLRPSVPGQPEASTVIDNLRKIAASTPMMLASNSMENLGPSQPPEKVSATPKAIARRVDELLAEANKLDRPRRTLELPESAR